MFAPLPIFRDERRRILRLGWILSQFFFFNITNEYFSNDFPLSLSSQIIGGVLLLLIEQQEEPTNNKFDSTCSICVDPCRFGGFTRGIMYSPLVIIASEQKQHKKNKQTNIREK